MSGEQQNQENLLNRCAACGAIAANGANKFCAACGRDLRREYEPLDHLRASYNLRKRETETFLQQPDDAQKLFDKTRNAAATTAMAFVVYSLVPFLGILFCPGAFVFGVVGLANAFSKPQIGGKQTARRSLLFGAFVFVVQILLWRLLYIVPELGKRI